MRLRLCEARPRVRGQGREVTKRGAAMAVFQVRSVFGFRAAFDLLEDLHALAI